MPWDVVICTINSTGDLDAYVLYLLAAFCQFRVCLSSSGFFFKFIRLQQSKLNHDFKVIVSLTYQTIARSRLCRHLGHKNDLGVVPEEQLFLEWKVHPVFLWGDCYNREITSLRWLA